MVHILVCYIVLFWAKRKVKNGVVVFVHVIIAIIVSLPVDTLLLLSIHVTWFSHDLMNISN